MPYSGGGGSFSGGTVTAPILFPDGTQANPSVAFASTPGQGFFKEGASALTFVNGGSKTHTLWSDGSLTLTNTAAQFSIGAAGDTLLVREAAGVISGSASAKTWVQNTGGIARVTGDVTNATTTFAAVTGLTCNVISGRKYTGRVLLRCDDSTAADGIKLDFNGGSATVSAFWAAASQRVGGTVVAGTVISTSLAGVINFTTITGDTYLEVDVSFVASSTGTFIMRAAQNAHTAGTLTIRTGSSWTLEDTP